jgi:hypothetical protein
MRDAVGWDDARLLEPDRSVEAVEEANAGAEEQRRHAHLHLIELPEPAAAAPRSLR